MQGPVIRNEVGSHCAAQLAGLGWCCTLPWLQREQELDVRLEERVACKAASESVLLVVGLKEEGCKRLVKGLEIRRLSCPLAGGALAFVSGS